MRDVDRPNIALLRWRFAADQRAGEVASLLRIPQLEGQRAMVFVPSTNGMSDLIDRLGDISFAEACGCMKGFVTDPSWHELHKRLRNGLIAPTDEEWAYS